MPTPRRRSASAAVYGLQGQVRTAEEVRFAESVSFKLEGTAQTIAEGTESDGEGSSGSDAGDAAVQLPKFVQPQRSSLRSRSNDALAGLGQLAINANQSPRAKRASKGLVVKREGSAVPRPPKTALPSAEKAVSRIQWKTHDGAVSVEFEGEGMTYLSNLYPQGPGQLTWRADVEWAGAETRPMAQQMYCSFRPRKGWKFGSCDGWGTLELAPPMERKEGSSTRIVASPSVRHVYDGQVDGPGCPGPQIHMHLESGTVSRPAPMLRAHGKGRMRYANGDRYDGQWVNSRREGQGKHKANGGLHQGVYEGAWAKDMRNGAGRYVDNAGNVMMGRWENNLPREGVMEWSTGETYDGWWSGSCEWILPADDHGAAEQRCTGIASFGDPDDGLRCRCLAHKKDNHVLLNPYQRHGKGTMKWTDGAVYQGQWENAKRHGKGVMRYGTADSIWSDGDVFEGIWRSDKIADGFEGTMTFADGGLYVGRWFRGLQHNGGVYTYPNGDVFEGEFRDGRRMDAAHGKMVYANGDVYTGLWVADKRHGEGTMKYANGDLYVGTWSDDMHLLGQRRYDATGHTYDGEWLNDVPHGHGKIIYGSDWQEGNASMKEGDVYEGPWENGRHAAGEVFIRYENGDLYRGGYEHSLRHGQGRMEYAHGNVFDGEWVRGSRRSGWVRAQIPGIGLYEGDWKDERPHGIGTLAFEDTGYYDGEWLAGLRHGQGTMSNGPWRSYTGSWLYDKFDGEGVLTDLRSCSTYTGGFRQGVKHGKGRESYGFIDAEFVGEWDTEKKRKGIFTFPDGTRWERVYDANEKLEREVLLGDKVTWKTLTARAFAQSRTLVAGDKEQISVGEVYANQECVADDSGRPIKTPTMLPHLGKSPHQNMGRQTPVALTSARKSPTTAARAPSRKMTNADLPSFLRTKTKRDLGDAISDAAQTARLLKTMDWGNLDELEDRHRKMDESLELQKSDLDAIREQQDRRKQEQEQQHDLLEQDQHRVREETAKIIDRASARQAKTVEELATMGALDITVQEESIDRLGVEKNARGCVEPHSGLPELWLIGGTEVDLNAHYEPAGELEYLVERAKQRIAADEPIRGKPLNQRAREAQRKFDPDLVVDHAEDSVQNVRARTAILTAFNVVADPKVKCYYCGQPGHFKNNCAALKRDSAIKIQTLVRGKLARNSVYAEKIARSAKAQPAVAMIRTQSNLDHVVAQKMAELEENLAKVDD